MCRFSIDKVGKVRGSSSGKLYSIMNIDWAIKFLHVAGDSS